MYTGSDPEACRQPFCCNGQCRLCHGTGIMRVDPALLCSPGDGKTIKQLIEEAQCPCPVCTKEEK